MPATLWLVAIPRVSIISLIIPVTDNVRQFLPAAKRRDISVIQQQGSQWQSGEINHYLFKYIIRVHWLIFLVCFH